MTPAAERARRLALAKEYPYAIPRQSYTYADGRLLPVVPDAIDGRIALAACGSNRSPQQLARKFQGWPPGTVIPVSLAWLHDHDVVHSAHFSRYGALPAALHPCPGVAVEIHVTWLTQRQLERMHETEGKDNYRFGPLDGARVTLAEGGSPARVFAYHGRHGAFAPAGTPIPLAAVAARGRTLTAGSQTQALAASRDRLAPGVALDRFILDTIDDPALRLSRTQALKRCTLPHR